MVCLGIPGITAHRAVFADGPVAGQTVLVHGIRGSVGSLAAQLAHWGGAAVIGTVRSDDFPQEAKAAAARDLTSAAAQGALSVGVTRTPPLAEIAAAHELVESGSAAGRVLVTIPSALSG